MRGSGLGLVHSLGHSEIHTTLLRTTRSRVFAIYLPVPFCPSDGARLSALLWIRLFLVQNGLGREHEAMKHLGLFR